jgi:glutamate--cysteine ligase
MLMRLDDERSVAVREPFPFGRWMRDGHVLGWPTEADLEYHLTTLFPPVRPRRWLELRMIDSLPDPWWPVAVAVTTALLDDPVAAAIATAACASLHDAWEIASREAMSAPRLLGSRRAVLRGRPGGPPATRRRSRDHRSQRRVPRPLCRAGALSGRRPSRRTCCLPHAGWLT